jgi:hypothetical protein
MTQCDYFGIMILGSMLVLLVTIFFGPSLLAFLRNSVDKMMKMRLQAFNPFRFIPSPIYAGALAIALFFTLSSQLPSKEKLVPCGPKGQAMMRTVVQVAGYVPLLDVQEAAAFSCGNQK